MRSVTLDDYYQGRQRAYAGEWNASIESEAKTLLSRVNMLLSLFKQDVEGVASGWRPPSYNAKVPNAAKKSKHMTGQAIDIKDEHTGFKDWCYDNQDLLSLCGLWMEHPASTKQWCHLQSAPPASGRRVFFP